MAFRALQAPAEQATGGFRPLGTGTNATTSDPTTFAGGIKQDFNRRSEIVRKAKGSVQAGTQSKASGLFQAMGQVAGLAADVGLEGAKAVDRKVTGGKVGEFLGKGMQAAVATKPVQKAVAGYGEFKAAHPEMAGNIEAATNIASIIPVGGALGLSVKGATRAAKATAEGTVELAGKAVAKTATASKGILSKGASAFTGVPQDVLERAASPERAHLTERAIKHVAENEKQPYLDVAHRTANAINAQDEKAARMLGTAKENFRQEFPNAAFDVRPKIPEIAGALEKFRSSGLIVEKVPDPMHPEVLSNFRIGKTAQSPFSTQEIGKLNNLFGKMMASGQVNVDDLLALRQSMSTAYNEVPLDINKKPTTYHAAIMSLKEVAEPAFENLLPPELRQAFKEYSVLQDMKEEIGNKIINGDGTLKDTAEQYLANLVNTNKGNARMSAERFKQLTGLDLESEVQAVKDAQKLTSFFPSTGSRTQDILRSLAVTGLGSFAGGPVGSALGIAATSPMIVGKGAVKLGKYLAKKGDQARSPELSSPARGLPPNAMQSPTKSTAPMNASMPKTLPQKDNLGDWMKKNAEKPGTTPDAEPFPAALQHKQLGLVIDKHILQAQIKIDTMGRRAMTRKVSMPSVLEETKTNLVKSLRDSGMPTFADALDKFDVTPFKSLQDFKDAVITYLRNVQPGLSMKNVGRVHPTDRQVMIDFIDAVRTGKVGGGSLTPAQRIAFETEARRAAPGYGINPDIAPAQLADKFDTLLSRSAEKKGKPLGQYLER